MAEKGSKAESPKATTERRSNGKVAINMTFLIDSFIIYSGEYEASSIGASINRSEGKE